DVRLITCRSVSAGVHIGLSIYENMSEIAAAFADCAGPLEAYVHNLRDPARGRSAGSERADLGRTAGASRFSAVENRADVFVCAGSWVDPAASAYAGSTPQAAGSHDQIRGVRRIED